MHIIKASPDPLLSSFRSLNEQRPTVPKEGVRAELAHNAQLLNV